MTGNSQYLIAAMDTQKVADNAERAGIAAIAMGEGGMLGAAEANYSHTPNARIREVFPTRCGHLSDASLDKLKADPRLWFDFIYGGELGNLPGTDDGFNFRGRGPLQITGRANYQRCGVACGHPEVVDSPDLVSTDPAIGAAMSVAFIRLNYHGGGFPAMLRAVGQSTPDIVVTKTTYYHRFLASGEFAAGHAMAKTTPTGAPNPPRPITPPSHPIGVTGDGGEAAAEALNAAELQSAA